MYPVKAVVGTELICLQFLCTKTYFIQPCIRGAYTTLQEPFIHNIQVLVARHTHSITEPTRQIQTWVQQEPDYITASHRGKVLRNLINYRLTSECCNASIFGTFKSVQSPMYSQCSTQYTHTHHLPLRHTAREIHIDRYIYIDRNNYMLYVHNTHNGMDRASGGGEVMWTDVLEEM